MDELEARVAALELIMMERLALDPPTTLRALREAINVEAYGEEKMIRAQADQIITDAIQRFDEFNTGWRIKPE